RLYSFPTRRSSDLHQLELAEQLRGIVARHARGNVAVCADADQLGVRRYRDARLEGVAVGRHDRAFFINLERAVARVGRGAVGQQHLEEAVALDGDVQRVAGLDQAAGGVDLGDGRRAHTVAELDALGNGRARRRLAACGAHGF